MTAVRHGRRAVLGGLGAAFAAPARAAAPLWTGRQFHNQPEVSHLHGFLTDLWASVAKETGGRLMVVVHAQNGDVPGSDPEALDMVADGRLEFFCVMGSILAAKAPLAEIQGLPFAFTSHAQVHAANDGALGALIGRDCSAHGLHRFPRGLMENGFRQIGMTKMPITRAEDLVGVRMRVPDGEIFRDLFTALECQPVTVNIRELYGALKDGRVDGQENPLVVTEFNKLYEVTRYVSITNHMWSGFNLVANLAFWNRLPVEVQAVVDRNVTRVTLAQRRYTDRLNKDLETSLAARGLAFNTADVSGFRRKLAGGFYPRWRRQFGETAWSVLQESVGAIG